MQDNMSLREFNDFVRRFQIIEGVNCIIPMIYPKNDEVAQIIIHTDQGAVSFNSNENQDLNLKEKINRFLSVINKLTLDNKKFVILSALEFTISELVEKTNNLINQGYEVVYEVPVILSENQTNISGFSILALKTK